MDVKTLTALKDTDQLARKEDLVASDIDDEIVMLDAEAGSYFGLNAVGAQVWKMLDTPLSFGEVREKLRELYDVTDVQCREDMTAFLQTMVDKGLVTVRACSA
jgi:hypothetical protein